VFFGENKGEQTTVASKRKGRIKDIILLALLAFALLFAAWKIFQDENGEKTSSVASTENERKVAQLLQEIEGVGEAEVIVYEDESGVKSVVVVCEGANDFNVIMDVREAVAAALGTKENAVKIYQKKD
jgi:flagellar biosynthesis component FlhA